MKTLIAQTVINTYFKKAAASVLAVTALSFITGVAAQPAARMGISPDRYHIEFDERGGEMQSLVIQNLSEKPLHLRFSVSNWDLDDNNQIVPAAPTETSLDQWIVINPLTITVPPGSPQTVRWAVMPRLKPEQGEYRAIIFVEEDLPAQETPDGTAVRMKMRYGMPIYAQYGDVVENASLHGVRADISGKQVFLDLGNEGNKHARVGGNFGVWPSSDFPGTDAALKQLRAIKPEQQADADFIVGNMPAAVVLPGDRRSMLVSPAIEELGDYTIQFNANFANLEIVETMNFSRRDIEDASDVRIADVSDDQRLISSAE